MLLPGLSGNTELYWLKVQGLTWRAMRREAASRQLKQCDSNANKNTNGEYLKLVKQRPPGCRAGAVSDWRNWPELKLYNAHEPCSNLPSWPSRSRCRVSAVALMHTLPSAHVTLKTRQHGGQQLENGGL